MKKEKIKALVAREIKLAEIAFLKEMLYEAIFTPIGRPKLPKTVINNPSLAKYTDNWGADDYDIALIAEVGGKPVGAIWGRKFSIENRGYGFVNELTPELSMAIKADYRAIGIGTMLIQLIENRYKEKGVKALSLSVDKSNPALRLYEKMGFRTTTETGSSAIMIKHL